MTTVAARMAGVERSERSLIHSLCTAAGTAATSLRRVRVAEDGRREVQGRDGGGGVHGDGSFVSVGWRGAGGGQAAANSALAPVMSMRISSSEREVSVISVTWMRWSKASCDTVAVVAPCEREAVAVDVDGDAVAGQQAGRACARAGVRTTTVDAAAGERRVSPARRRAACRRRRRRGRRRTWRARRSGGWTRTPCRR